MKTQNSIYAALPVLFGFFVMGFCDIVGISSDYVLNILERDRMELPQSKSLFHNSETISKLED